MNTSLSCDEESRRLNAERYVARRMDAKEAEAFEDHYVTCAECQREVRLASATAAGLSRGSATPRPVSTARRIWIWGGGAIAIAASVATLAVLRQPTGEIVALGAVREPPVFLGIRVRGVDVADDTLFDAAMDAYAKRRYADAAAGLRATLAAGRDSVAAQFFLAASQLLSDQPRDAADGFARVLARGDTPYRAEARYYRAKALLRSGRSSDALEELRRVTRADGVTYEMASALADSVALLRDK